MKLTIVLTFVLIQTLELSFDWRPCIDGNAESMSMLQQIAIKIFKKPITKYSILSRMKKKLPDNLNQRKKYCAKPLSFHQLYESMPYC